MLVSPPNKFCKSHDATGVDPVIRIEHAVTDDLPDGSPTVPGFVDDGILWALVVALPGGRTRWRSISLQQNTVRPLGVKDETVDRSRRHAMKG